MDEAGVKNYSPVPVVTAEELTASCPMSGMLAMLTRPWMLHILWLLSRNGPMRFGALRRGVEGISARLLTVRLRTLEQRGLVRRTVVEGRVPEVTYSPTSRVADMQDFMEQLSRVSEKWDREDAHLGMERTTVLAPPRG